MDKIRIGDKTYVTIDDYAKIKGVSRKTVYNMIKDERVIVKKVLNRQFIELN